MMNNLNQLKFHEEVEARIDPDYNDFKIVIIHTARNKVKNIKTGNPYWVIAACINATNANDEQKMVVYQNREGQIFCRELEEFLVKFKVDKSDIDGFYEF